MRTLANVAVAQMLPAGAVKGGTAMNLRRGPDASRFSTDLDVTRHRDTSEDAFIQALNDSLRTGWGGFSGTATRRPKAKPRAVPTAYVMLPVAVSLQYQGRVLASVKLEVAIDEVGSLDAALEAVAPEIVELFTSVGLPAPDPVSVVSAEHQFVQKLHTCTTPDSDGRNERAHDLVDLQLLCLDEDLDLELLDVLGRRLFSFRQGLDWPPTVVAHEGWDSLYATAAEGLAVRPLADALGWVNDLIARAVDIH